MPIAEVTTVITSLKAAIEISKGILNLTKEAAVKEKVIEFQSKILDLQSGLLQLQVDYSGLVDENVNLKKQLNAQADWETLKSNYKLKEIARSVFVQEFCGDGQKHWLCITCFDSGKKSILQLKMEAMSGDIYKCNGCDKEITDHSKQTDTGGFTTEPHL